MGSIVLQVERTLLMRNYAQAKKGLDQVGAPWTGMRWGRSRSQLLYAKYHRQSEYATMNDVVHLYC